MIRGEAGSPPVAAPIGQILASQAIVHVLSATRYQTVVDELRDLLEGKFGTPPGKIDPTVQRAVSLDRRPGRGSRGAARARRRPRGREGSRGERGGAAPAGALRRGGRAAPARDPRPLERRGVAARWERRPDAGRAHPGGRPHRAGDRDRGDRGRGGRHEGLRQADRGPGADRGRPALAFADSRRRGCRGSSPPETPTRTADCASRPRWSEPSTEPRAGRAGLRRGGRCGGSRARRSASSRR